MPCQPRVLSFLLGLQVPLATSQWDAMIFHSLLLIRTLSFWLLEFTLIHLQSQLQHQFHSEPCACLPAPAVLMAPVVCGGGCCSWLSVYPPFPSFLPVVRGRAEGRRKALPPDCQPRACLFPLRKSFRGHGLLTWGLVCKSGNPIPQGPVDGSSALLSFVSLDHTGSLVPHCPEVSQRGTCLHGVG